MNEVVIPHHEIDAWIESTVDAFLKNLDHELAKDGVSDTVRQLMSRVLKLGLEAGLEAGRAIEREVAKEKEAA